MTVMMDELGFGPYRVLARAGQGARGPVFVAKVNAAATADSLYLLEVSGFTSGEDEPLRAFVRDTESAARIQHRNVLGIVERGATTAGHYIVMPYIEGCTLAEIEERQRTLRSPWLVIAAVLDALHGIHAAHSFRKDGAAQPLIHGSVSPDQLLIGLDGICRISGFGAARPRIQTKPSNRIAAATAYLSPEQVNGATIDHRADLFAIGVVLWNALTGKKLFHDPIEHMTMSNVLDRMIPRPSTIGLSPPPILDGIVMKALERDPARRFQSAAEMADALRDVARGAASMTTGAELAAWVSAAFGTELATRRHVIRELAARPQPPGAQLAVLPRLVARPSADAVERDYLSLDELARAVEPAPWFPPVPSPSPPSGRSRPPSVPSRSPDPAPNAYPEAPRPRRLALVASAAFAVVAGVLGWRWSVMSSTIAPVPAGATAAGATHAPAPAPPPRPPGIEITVLDVRSIPEVTSPKPASPAIEATSPAIEPAPPAIEPAPPAIEPAPPAIEAASPAIEPASPAIEPAPPAIEPARAPAAASPGRPPRTVRRPPRPSPPSRSSEVRAESPEPKTLEPAPARPESARPPLEANPYIYK